MIAQILLVCHYYNRKDYTSHGRLYRVPDETTYLIIHHVLAEFDVSSSNELVKHITNRGFDIHYEYRYDYSVLHKRVFRHHYDADCDGTYERWWRVLTPETWGKFVSGDGLVLEDQWGTYYAKRKNLRNHSQYECCDMWFEVKVKSS